MDANASPRRAALPSSAAPMRLGNRAKPRALRMGLTSIAAERSSPPSVRAISRTRPSGREERTSRFGARLPPAPWEWRVHRQGLLLSEREVLAVRGDADDGYRGAQARSRIPDGAADGVSVAKQPARQVLVENRDLGRAFPVGGHELAPGQDRNPHGPKVVR